MDNKVLLIGYDYHLEGKAKKSLAIASLQATIEKYLPQFIVETFSFDVNEYQTLETTQFEKLMNVLEREYNYIAIGYYGWSKTQCLNLLEVINKKYPETVIILGGYEVNRQTLKQLNQKLADTVDYYIVGYAEESLIRILEGNSVNKVMDVPLKTIEIPPVYSSGVIDLTGVNNVRIETKRGCPMQCSYCSYSSNDHKNRIVHNMDTVKQEFDFLNDIVEKVNVIDPIFTIDNYMDVLNYLISIDFKPLISFQIKFELFYRLIKNTNILEKLNRLNTVLEFGFQTGNESVHELMHRNFDLDKSMEVLKTLSEYSIEYEISVIRGLPGETFKTYQNMINLLKDKKVKNVHFYPLTLLSNTRLSDEADTLSLETFTHNNLEYVCKTFSYTYEDYEKMKQYENNIV